MAALMYATDSGLAKPAQSGRGTKGGRHWSIGHRFSRAGPQCGVDSGKVRIVSEAHAKVNKPRRAGFFSRDGKGRLPAVDTHIALHSVSP